MAVLTLNQVKNEIRTFAASHAQLHTAKFCKQDELLTAGDIVYPALYFDFETAKKEGNQMHYSFSAIVADRIHPEKDNEPDVWSDTVLIANDLLGFLDGHTDWRLQDGAPIVPFSDDLADKVSGVRVEFVLMVPFPYDRCVVPGNVISESHTIITEDGTYLLTESGLNLIT